MAETLARSLIRLLVTVGILAAIYFFAIKPILDTTNDTIDRAFGPLDGLQEEIQQSFEEAGVSSDDVDRLNLKGTSANEAERLLECVQRAQPDTAKIQRCANKFK